MLYQVSVVLPRPFRVGIRWHFLYIDSNADGEERSVMAQIYVFGRVMHELTPKESQSKQPYVCFDLVERSGGEHPNFYQVWARGDQVARLTRLKVKKGSMIWLTGSQKLVDVRQKDGATVKKLKVWLTDFGFLPGQSSRAKAEHEQHIINHRIADLERKE